jgi:quinol monooxygenase YgiN
VDRGSIHGGRNHHYLIDAFDDADGLNAHMAGEAAASILGEGGPLLADTPTISNLSIVAAKSR